MDTGRLQNAISRTVPSADFFISAFLTMTWPKQVETQCPLVRTLFSPGGLRLSMPVHPHLGDPAVGCLTEDRPFGLDPLSGAPSSEDSLELRREPGTDREDLATADCDLGLVDRHIAPIAPDGIGSVQGPGKRGFQEDRISIENGDNQVDLALRPAPGEGIDQLTSRRPKSAWIGGSGHGCNI